MFSHFSLLVEICRTETKGEEASDARCALCGAGLHPGPWVRSCSAGEGEEAGLGLGGPTALLWLHPHGKVRLGRGKGGAQRQCLSDHTLKPVGGERALCVTCILYWSATLVQKHVLVVISE